MHYFPEVEGCESLKKPGFNRKEQLKKLFVMFPATAAGLADVCAVIGWLTDRAASKG